MPSITVRLTDADNARITDAVTRSGMTRSDWVRAALLRETGMSAVQPELPQTAGAKSGAGGIVRGQVVPATRVPERPIGSYLPSAEGIPTVATCRHPRLRRIGKICSKCGQRVKR